MGRGAIATLIAGALLTAAAGPVPAMAGSNPAQSRSQPMASAAARGRLHRQIARPAHLAASRSFTSAAPSRRAAPLPNQVTTGTWAPLGPQPLADEKVMNGPNPVSDYGPASGRVTGLVTDPTNPSTVYAGTAGGGVWKSTDGGRSWSTTTDSQPSLAIGAIAIDAAGTTIYAATGEDNGNADRIYGEGILKSTDGGQSWSVVGQGFPFAAGGHIGGIAVDRTTSGAAERVIIGGDRGLWISTDSGATWGQINLPAGILSPITPGGTPSGDVIQVLQDPGALKSGTFWAVATDFCKTEAGDILRSDDQGVTWLSVYKSPAAAARISLGLGHDGTGYAAVAGGCGTVNIGKFANLDITTDDGNSWGPTPTQPPDYFSFSGNNQGWYDNVLAVDPSNSLNLLLGGITVLRSSDGGSSFTDVGQPYNGGSIHPDFHALAFTGPGAAYAGNDGGIWYTPDLGSTWSNRNGNLSTMQFYSGTSPDPTHVVGGAQDNGTSGILPGSPAVSPAWQQYLDGDGGQVLLDPTPGSTTIYAGTDSGGLWKGSYQLPASPDPNWPLDSFVDVSPCPASPPNSTAACSQPVAFIAPVVMDQSTPARLLTATNEVYQTTNGGSSWTPISPSLATATPPPSESDYIASLAMGSSAATANTVYAGSEFGALYVTSNANGSPPSWITASTGLPAFSTANRVTGHAWISGIALNDANPAEAWVTIGGMNVGHVWHTTNSGASWADVSGSGATGVPANLPVNGILFDPTTPGTVDIATDTGVMACSACSGAVPVPVWTLVGAGLPNTEVSAVTETRQHNQLVAWTHGRGAWMVPVGPILTVSPTQLSFSVGEGGATPAPQTVTVRNDGLGTLNWAAAAVTNPPGQTWLQPPSPPTGSDGPRQSTPVQVSVSTAGVPAGTYSGSVSFTSPDGGSASVSVSLTIPVFPGQYRPVVPKRILDTRNGTGGFSAPVTPSNPIDVQVAGVGPVPAMSSSTPPSAVVLNVTVTNETQPSHVIIWPTGAPRPNTSNLNFSAKQDVPNLVEVALGSGGKVSAFVNAGSTDIIFDVAGWVTTAGTVGGTDGRYRPVSPHRILDTRGGAPVGQQAPYRLQVAGSAGSGIPAMGAGGPEAVVLNLTITNPTYAGYVTVYPSDASRPDTSNINVTPGLTRANRVAVKLGADGAVNIFNYAGTTDVVIDVNGWFTDSSATAGGGQFTGLVPARLLDTRFGTGGVNGPLAQGQEIPLQVSGRGGVPDIGAPLPPTAVVLNVTATDTTRAGYLQLSPDTAARGTSDLNWLGPGQTVPNLVVVKLDSSGKVHLYNCCGSTDVVVDVFGWYQ